MPGSKLSDETLMAYADGELPGDVAETVELAMLDDPHVVQSVVEFLRSRRMARGAASAQGLPDIPPALRETVEQHARGGAAAQQRPAGFTRRGPWSLAPIALAAAAGVALLVVGLRSASPPEQAGERVAFAAPLADARLPGLLSTLPTGAEVPLDGGRVRIIASYGLKDGSVCREVVLGGDGQTTSAVTCRDRAAWSWRFASTEAAPAGAYSTAGDGSLVQAYLAAIGAGSPLPAERERSVLARPLPE